MSADKGDGPKGAVDGAVAGARPGRWRGDGQRDGAVPRRSRQGHDRVPQPRHATTRPRSCGPRRAVACASCSRAYPIVDAATTLGQHGRVRRRHVHEGQARAAGLAARRLPAQAGHARPAARERGVEEGRGAAARAAAAVRPRDRAEAGRHQAHPGARHRRLAADHRSAAARSRRSRGTARHSQMVIPNPLGQCSQTQLDAGVPAVHLHPGVAGARGSGKGTTTLVLPFDKNLTPLHHPAVAARAGRRARNAG